MAGPNGKAFRSMLRSSTIKKACDRNAASIRERDIKTMSDLAGDMARGMKISKRVFEKKRAIGTKEGPHETISRAPPSGSSLTDFKEEKKKMDPGHYAAWTAKFLGNG